MSDGHQTVPPDASQADLAVAAWQAATQRQGTRADQRQGARAEQRQGTRADQGGDHPAEALDLARPGPDERPLHGRGFTYFTRLWALLKMASFFYSTWWVLGMGHPTPAIKACALGGACYFVAVGGRWRKRWFGPGQLLEPDLYELVGRCAALAGTVAVLASGAFYVAALVH